jgi:hypothetical protein
MISASATQLPSRARDSEQMSTRDLRYMQRRLPALSTSDAINAIPHGVPFHIQHVGKKSRDVDGYYYYR